MMTPEQLTGKTTQHLMEVHLQHQSVLVHAQITHDLTNLITAANSAGYQMMIASGFRDYHRQQTIWNRKFSGKTPLLDKHSLPLCYEELNPFEKVSAILRWSALPGASRHHWGSDFDVYSKNHIPENKTLKLEPWEYLNGHQTEFYHWLSQTMPQFGFFFPYAKDQGGVSIEPWHISHIATSQKFMKQLTTDLIKSALLQDPILGNEIVLAHLDNIYNQYIININLE